MSTKPRLSIPWRPAFFSLVGLLGAVCGAASVMAGATTLFVSDGDVIHAYDAATGALAMADIPLQSVTGIAIGPGGDLYAVGSPAPIFAPQVYRFNAMTGAQIGGPFVTFTGQNDGHDVQGPGGMAFGPNGDLYIADVTLSNVHHYDTAGNSVASLSDLLVQPTDVAFDSAGNLYAVNPGFASVERSSGGTQPFVDFVSSQSGGLTIPQALTFGPDGKLYVLDASTNSGPAIRRYTSTGADDGTVISYAQSFFQPNDLAFGPDGKLYISGIDLGLAVGQVNRYLIDGTPDGSLVASGSSYPTFMAFSVAVPEPSSSAMTALACGAASIVLILRRSRGARQG